MEMIGLVLSAIGLIPILGIIWFWMFRFQGARRFLQFGAHEAVDVVLTTSAIAVPAQGAPVTRPLTGIGQVDSIGFFARALGAHYRKKPLRIQMSSYVRARLDADLVVIGGPAKNRVAKEFLEAIDSTFPELRLQFDDIGCNLTFSEKEIVRDFNPLEGVDGKGFPVFDIGLIIGWRNPYTHNWKRAFMCAGFTTFGTAAASEYLFSEILARHTGLNAAIGGVGKQKRYPRCFIEIISVRFSEGVPYALERVPNGFAELDAARRVVHVLRSGSVDAVSAQDGSQKLIPVVKSDASQRSPEQASTLEKKKEATTDSY
jgi:hypothetical protein